MRATRPATIVALIFTLSLVAYFDRNLLGIFAPAVMRELSFSEETMGWIFFAFRIPYALMNLVGGILADRLGPRLVLGIVAAGSAVLTALFALAGGGMLAVAFGSAGSFLALRAAAGVFQGPLYPSLARVNASWVAPARRSAVQGLIAAGAGIGGAATALVPLAFAELQAAHWRAAFVGAGAITLLFTLVWLVWYRDPQPHLAAVSAAANAPVGPPLWRALLTNRNLVVLTLSYFANCYFVYVFFDWTKYYCQEVRQLSDAESNWATFWVWMGWFALSPAGGWACDRLVRRFGLRRGIRIVPIASLTASALLLCAVSSIEDPYLLVATLALSLGLASAADAPFWAAAIHAGGHRAGAACGLFNTLGNVGGIGTWVTARIASQWGWSAGLYSACAVLAVGIVLWFAVRLEPLAEERS